MNAKETILLYLKIMRSGADNKEMFDELINATESAIFEVPSEDEIDERIKNVTSANWKAGYFAAINYILNYKK